MWRGVGVNSKAHSVLVRVVILVAALVFVFVFCSTIYNAELNGLGSVFAKTGVDGGIANVILACFTAAAVAGFIAYCCRRHWQRSLLPLPSSSNNVNFNRLVFISVVVAAVAVRLLFLLGDYTPTSDMEVYYSQAESLVQTGGLTKGGASGIAMWPYKLAYTFILSVFMHVFGVGFLAVIAMNTAFDIVGGYFAYRLMKRVAEDGVGRAAALLYLLNPANIAFCATNLDSCVTNSLAMIVLFLSYWVVAVNGISKRLPLMLLLGFLVAALCIIKPFMMVFVVVLALFFLLTPLHAGARCGASALSSAGGRESVRMRKGEACRLGDAGVDALTRVACICVIGALLLASQQLWLVKVGEYTGDAIPADNASGWTMFVGANYENAGQFNSEDVEEYSEVLEEVSAGSKDFDDVHAEMQRRAVERYRKYGMVKSLKLFFKKAIVFAGTSKKMVRPLRNAAPSDTAPFLAMVSAVQIFHLFAIGLCLVAIQYIIRRRRVGGLQGRYSFMLLPILLYVGLFLSFMLTEVQPRYYMIEWPSITLIAAFGLDVAGKGIRRRRAAAEGGRCTPHPDSSRM
jgi:hypothetical protein